MRQHLANAIFRAVENDRPVLRVTNTGYSAMIDEDRGDSWIDRRLSIRTLEYGHVPSESTGDHTFYTKYGDFFVQAFARRSRLWFSSRFSGSAGEGVLKIKMNEPLSIQELRTSFDNLRARVDQLGRFL